MDVGAPEKNTAREHPAQKRDAGRAALIIGAALVCFVKLWLLREAAVVARGAGVIDDALYVEQAQSILGGAWLGPYSPVVLFKGPGYPLWLVFCHLLRVPALLGVHLLYLGACGLVVVSCRHFIRSRLLLAALFLALVFSPHSYDQWSICLQRYSLYAALLLLTFGCLTGLLGACLGSVRRLTLWSAGLGMAMSFLWIVREEGALVLPGVFLILGYAGLRIGFSHSRGKLVRVGLLLLPVGILWASVACICTINYRHYGIYCVSELKMRPYRDAWGWSLRAGYPFAKPPEALPKEARLRLYDTCPSFAELRPFLEGFPKVSPWVPADGKWPTPLLLLAFRTAAAEAGHYSNAQDAMRFYDTLAEEIRSAYEAGELECGPPGISPLPPWRSCYATMLPQRLAAAVTKLVTLQECEVREQCSSGPPNSIHAFGEIALEQLVPRRDSWRAGAWRPEEEAQAHRRKMAFLSLVKSAYGFVMPIAVALSCVSFGVMLVVSRCKRARLPLLVLGAAVLSMIVIRLTLVSYVDAAWNQTLAWRYLGVLLPLLILFCFLSAATLVPRRSGDQSEPASGPHIPKPGEPAEHG